MDGDRHDHGRPTSRDQDDGKEYRAQGTPHAPEGHATRY